MILETCWMLSGRFGDSAVAITKVYRLALYGCCPPQRKNDYPPPNMIFWVNLMGQTAGREWQLLSAHKSKMFPRMRHRRATLN